MIAGGYKDYDGHGKQNGSSGSNFDQSSTKKIQDNAASTAKYYDISIGRIPWKTKITGKLQNKCNGSSSSSSSSTTVTLGTDKWNAGRTNWRANKNLYGEVSFTRNSKKGTLYLKWEGSSNNKKGWYGWVPIK